MTSHSTIFPLLRRAAPRLSRHFFACRDCQQRPAKTAQIHIASAGRAQFKSTRQTPFLKAFRSQSTNTAALGNESPISKLGEGLLEKSAPKAKSHTRAGYLPLTTRRSVAYWLYGSAASVFGIVVFGGLTRLTESGLSITEWRPVTGTLPPLSYSAWDTEFTKYKASPEFQKLNPNMDLSEFKRIFWMEYTHRLWGRLIGLSFLLPTIYFIARKRVSFPVARNLLLINALIGLQGVVGWWMVASGLKDDLFAADAHPRVSQYRLATHLGLAFSVFVAMLWNGLQIQRERYLTITAQPNRAQALLARLSSPTLRPLRIGTALLAALIGTTALSGALVAGLDAGLIYNEFPSMGNGLTPPASELWDPFYSRLPAPHADLWWRNMLENPSLVQLDHRILATSSFLAVHALFFYARFSPAVRGALTRGGKMALTGMLGMVWVQVALGLGTLLYLVPVPVAAAHQAGSLVLVASLVVFGSRLWTTPRLARLVARRLQGVRGVQARRMEMKRPVEAVVKPRTGPRLY